MNVKCWLTNLLVSKEYTLDCSEGYAKQSITTDYNSDNIDNHNNKRINAEDGD